MAPPKNTQANPAPDPSMPPPPLPPAYSTRARRSAAPAPISTGTANLNASQASPSPSAQSPATPQATGTPRARRPTRQTPKAAIPSPDLLPNSTPARRLFNHPASQSPAPGTPREESPPAQSRRPSRQTPKPATPAQPEYEADEKELKKELKELEGDGEYYEYNLRSQRRNIRREPSPEVPDMVHPFNKPDFDVDAMMRRWMERSGEFARPIRTEDEKKGARTAEQRAKAKNEHDKDETKAKVAKEKRETNALAKKRAAEAKAEADRLQAKQEGNNAAARQLKAESEDIVMGGIDAPVQRRLFDQSKAQTPVVQSQGVEKEDVEMAESSLPRQFLDQSKERAAPVVQKERMGSDHTAVDELARSREVTAVGSSPNKPSKAEPSSHPPSSPTKTATSNRKLTKGQLDEAKRKADDNTLSKSMEDNAAINAAKRQAEIAKQQRDERRREAEAKNELDSEDLQREIYKAASVALASASGQMGDDDAAAGTAPVKKGRGRPRKIQPAVSNSRSSSEQMGGDEERMMLRSSTNPAATADPFPSTQAEKAKKPTGRPRKIQPAADTAGASGQMGSDEGRMKTRSSTNPDATPILPPNTAAGKAKKPISRPRKIQPAVNTSTPVLGQMGAGSDLNKTVSGTAPAILPSPRPQYPPILPGAKVERPIWKPRNDNITTSSSPSPSGQATAQPQPAVNAALAKATKDADALIKQLTKDSKEIDDEAEKKRQLEEDARKKAIMAAVMQRKAHETKKAQEQKEKKDMATETDKGMGNGKLGEEEKVGDGQVASAPKAPENGEKPNAGGQGGIAENAEAERKKKIMAGVLKKREEEARKKAEADKAKSNEKNATAGGGQVGGAPTVPENDQKPDAGENSGITGDGEDGEVLP